MSDRRILMLENSITKLRMQHSALQSKFARQSDDVTRLRDRVDTLMLDKKAVTKELNLMREKQDES
tara:strand:+ start:444 stop:641 length:198 start_codon:yes stop_codon:yes gene_type:complete